MAFHLTAKQISASDDYELSIITLGEDQTSAQRQPISGVRYDLFLVNNDQTLEGLNQLTPEALKDQSIKHWLTEPTDQQGRVDIGNLAGGLYYVKPATQPDSNQKIIPFLVFLPGEAGENKLTVYPKINIETGEVLLKKYTTKNEQMKYLAGAEFELYDEHGTTPIRVKNGQVTTELSAPNRLVTNKDGEIHITHLKPGRYYFKEVKAPTGYQLDGRNIWFTIQSSERVYVSHANKPTPPSRPPWLPQTGESVLLALGGVLLIVIGMYLGRRSKSSE